MAVLKTTYIDGNLVVNGKIVSRNLKYLGDDILHLLTITQDGNDSVIPGKKYRIPVFADDMNALGNSALEVSTTEGVTTLKIKNSWDYNSTDLDSTAGAPEQLRLEFAQTSKDNHDVKANRIQVQDTDLIALVKVDCTVSDANTVKISAPYTVVASSSIYKDASGSYWVDRNDIDNASIYEATAGKFEYKTDLTFNDRYTKYSIA